MDSAFTGVRKWKSTWSFSLAYRFSKDLVVDVRAQVPHGGVQQVQIVLQAQALEAAVGGGVELLSPRRRRPR